MKGKQQIMSPHDIVILLKIVNYNKESWFQKPLAEALGISQSEISKSLNRSKYAGLLAPNGKKVMRMALMDFLQYGLRYVFPIKPGAMVRGVPTSHSASPLKEDIQSSEAYVWPYGKGTVRGHSIMPLYPSVPEAALKDEKLHELLALVDAIRVGRAREREMAVAILKNDWTLENRTINIAVVAEVAKALQEMKQEMVFVGGAVVSLYADDPAADEIRPTQDIDMTLNIVNLNHWEKVQRQLGTLGFHPDPQGHAICSYKYKDIPVDIMATEEGPLGPANRWYKIGFENLWTTQARDQEIKILSAPCFLATKFEAFNDRGTDYRTSHDIEDIIYVLDNRIGIAEEITNDDTRIANFIKEQLQIITNRGLIQEVLMAHVHPLMMEERLPIIEEKITQIITQ